MSLSNRCRFCRQPIPLEDRMVRYSKRSYAHEKCWLERTRLELANRGLGIIEPQSEAAE